jgi:hypothetical protein
VESEVDGLLIEGEIIPEPLPEDKLLPIIPKEEN